MITEQNESISPSSSVTSGTDVYMDAIDALNDKQSGKIFQIIIIYFSFYILDGSLTPIYYGSYSKEIIDTFAMNLHRIDKDVSRCDRNYSYFINLDNLKKLRNIMCT